jgi:hypothetical protein
MPNHSDDQGFSRFETLAGFFRGQCSPRQPSRECLSDGRMQIIALQIQSHRRLLEVMKGCSPFGLNTPSFYRSQT